MPDGMDKVEFRSPEKFALHQSHEFECGKKKSAAGEQAEIEAERTGAQSHPVIAVVRLTAVYAAPVAVHLVADAEGLYRSLVPCATNIAGTTFRDE